ncbi:hypothetical protein RJ55_00871 [Drechmeria coniospora]|nr:hypothetical protein RJ55_00871 [Drechmeria coniospora]
MATNARNGFTAGYEGKDDGRNGASSRPDAAPLPHIDDILARPTDIDANQSIKRLLEQAETAFKQSEISRDFNRPDVALKEYIRASIIAVQVISKHQDYHAQRSDHGDVGKAHATLLKKISQQNDAYERIKHDIMEDNKRTGVLPVDPRIKTYTIPAYKETPKLPESRVLTIDIGADPSALPKIPDAIYSPARGSVSGEAARLPTSTPRGLFTRRASSPSVPSTPSISQHQGSEYFPPVPEEAVEHITIPEGDSVTAEQLYDIMKGKGSILLIDVRPRGDFDDGHIMSSSIICVEPSILLRDNISSDDISESMVLSPQQDQPLFEKRDKYDLVVFYDQNSERIIQSPKNSDEVVVLSLHRALVHLNYGRELRRPPVILKGGLDAWIDLMGSGALQSTSAATSTSVRPNRRHGVIQRRGSKYVVAPLLPADVRAWQNTLEKEAHQTATRPIFPRTGEEFLRSRPELTEKQSMRSSVAAEDQHMHKFDSHAQLPAPPTRPRAAVQRPSHSGLSHGDEDDWAGGRSRKATDQVSTSAPRMPTGLSNPRNWCYANSVLQSLLASPEFGRELADSEWVQKYDVPRKEGETINPPQLMIQMLSKLFHWMSTGMFETIKATTLMDYSKYLCKASDPQSQFGGLDQQDAQEFMSFLMDQVHDETNSRRNLAKPRVAQPETRGRALVEAAIEYWGNYSVYNQSMVDRFWRGVDLSTVRCMQCDSRTYTFSPFGWIPVPVGNGRDMTLAEALGQYIAGNRLDDFACDHCGGKRKALQSMSLARMPPLLCLSFRRFDYCGGGLTKSTAAISWDFNDFDFSPYFVDRLDGEFSKAHDKAFGGPFRYQCYAVISHSGNNINAGHYIAHVRDSNSRDPYAWFRCNDTTVSKVRIGSGESSDKQKEVFRGDAGLVPYLVFFRRKGA